jgi:hypothetical protein
MTEQGRGEAADVQACKVGQDDACGSRNKKMDMVQDGCLQGQHAELDNRQHKVQEACLLLNACLVLPNFNLGATANPKP